MIKQQLIKDSSDPSTTHPDYDEVYPEWQKVRDCVKGEARIKSKEEEYLPRPAGMAGEFKDAYDTYLERAHFPLICSYALQGALGIIVTKLPDFNVPKKMEYLLENATKDGVSLPQLFLDTIIEVFKTGRCPLMVDIVPEDRGKEFKFVRYPAESLINWKSETVGTEKNLILSVFSENAPETDDIFSHDAITIYRVLYIDENGNYSQRVFEEDVERIELAKVPGFMGKTSKEVPVFIAGSINSSYDVQPIPLISVANCSIQIYRKEADLSNSEYLSCNPTLVITGVSDEDDLPNVVGSSVLVALPDPASRAFYTITDTKALAQIKIHIDDMYEEAIRHGVSILESRKGVESAEALRIRQATQSASVYSIYLAALEAVVDGLKYIARMWGLDESEVVADAPSSLTYGIPDSSLVSNLVEGFAANVIPLRVVHKYLVTSGLIEQGISFDEYEEMLKSDQDIKLKSTNEDTGENLGDSSTEESSVLINKQ